jgi:hypothetical protein
MTALDIEAIGAVGMLKPSVETRSRGWFGRPRGEERGVGWKQPGAAIDWRFKAKTSSEVS